MDRSLDEAHEPLYFRNMNESGCMYDSPKRTEPRWTLPKASRDTEKKVYISKKHPQDLLGKDSPGFEYEPKRIKELPKWGFGTAAARPPLSKARYPETSNNLIGVTPDMAGNKFETKQPIILGAARDAAYYQPDFDGFPPGAISPGPQRYTPAKSKPAIRLGHAPSIDQIPPSYTMRPFYAAPASRSQTGPKVGPGLYPHEEACTTQTSSEKPTLPQWGINKIDRFKAKDEMSSGRLWDGNGEKAIQFNRTFNQSPAFSFGTSTRNHAKKVTKCETKLDKGPSAFMDKPWKSHPTIPTRKELIKYTDLPSG